MASDESPEKSGGMSARLARIRERFPAVDRVLRMQEHYGKVRGGVLASSATYFAFLSFFPLLAVAFSVVGYVSEAFPNARDSLVTAIEEYLPGIVSEDGGSGTISLAQIENARVTVGVIGFVGVLYSGLGWISALRIALADAFEVPRKEQRNFVVGKGIDLLSLALLGVILIASVAVSGLVTGWAQQILEAVSLDDSALGSPLIWSISTVLGIAVSTVLFFVMYRVLGDPAIPTRPLWGGALLAAVGFEVLKIIAVNVVGAFGGSGFAPLAIAITLVIWINYFSKLAVYGACWAMTTGQAQRALAVAAAQTAADEAAAAPEPAPEPATVAEAPPGRFDTGSVVLGALGGVVAGWIAGRRRR